MAPSILHKFLDEIVTDPKEIVRTNFAGVAKCLCEKDMKAIGVACSNVEKKKLECGCKSGRWWRIFEIIFAIIGVILLWRDWICIPWVAKWSLVLFLPVGIAIGWPYICYRRHFKPLQKAINTALTNARKQKKQQDLEREIDNDEYINQFVTNAMNAAGKH